jgi:4-carboxymuconolactone decarboxylase
MSDNYDKGLQARREVMGDAFVDRALGNATDFTQPLQDFVNEHAWAASGPVAAWTARPAA